MVLLKSVWNSPGSPTWARTEKGEDVMLDGIPHPDAIAVYDEKNIDKELEALRDLARKDGSNYYLIQDSSGIMDGKRNNPNTFAIAYLTFIK